MTLRSQNSETVSSVTASSTIRHGFLYPTPPRALLRLSPDDLAYIITHADDRVIFVDQSLLPILEKIRDRIPCVRQGWRATWPAVGGIARDPASITRRASVATD